MTAKLMKRRNSNPYSRDRNSDQEDANGNQISTFGNKNDGTKTEKSDDDG